MATGVIKDPYKGREYWQRLSIPNANSQYPNNYVEFNKRGHVVQVTLGGSVKGTIDGVETLQLGTIDNQLVPFTSIDVASIDLNGFNKGVDIVIASDGVVIMYIYGPAGVINAKICATYLTDR